MRGFTLIELILVFAILAIMMSVGVTSYSGYTNAQTFQLAVADVSGFLTTAKSRALSQIKPTECGTQVLQGYKVVINLGNSNYELDVVCGGNSYTIDKDVLPKNVTFVNGSTVTTTFSVSSAVSTPSTITINGFGKTKIITVTTAGNISVN